MLEGWDEGTKGKTNSADQRDKEGLINEAQVQPIRAGQPHSGGKRSKTSVKGDRTHKEKTFKFHVNCNFQTIPREVNKDK